MSDNHFDSEIPAEIAATGLLKFRLLASGLKISPTAAKFVESAKGPIRTRSGASGGLDLILPHNIHVNCPVHESFADRSPLLLDCESDTLVLKEGSASVAPVKLQPQPGYYQSYTSDGVPMHKVGQMCSGDRFCYGMTGPYCRFWKTDTRCRFCSIGLNRERDASGKTIAQLVETLSMAVNDPRLPAKHVLIGGGTPNSDDMGAVQAAEICAVIKKHFSLSCYVMICAPLRNEYIKRLFDSGADELGMNIEFYSDKAWKEFIPGKWHIIGKKRYFEALEYAVSLFGPINTRSLLVVGLEDPTYTIEGAERLASLGVMPILSPFRPLKDTPLAARTGFDYATYWSTYMTVHDRASKHLIPTGPTCIPCQNNTLALPLPDSHYRFY